MTSDATKYYLHYDQVGTLRAVSDTNHNIIKETTYDTYGSILSDTNKNFKIPFGFAGGLHDTDTNLVHFGYREYDPHTGKWTAKDPIDFSGGDSNLYGYVLGDPVGFVDPTGLFDDPVLNGLNATLNYLGTINSTSVWRGVNNVNTFSTAAAIGFSSDEKTLPFAAFFGTAAAMSELALCFSPDKPSTLPDVLGKSLVDEIIPGHGFKSMTVKEFIKYGVTTYDN